MTEIRYVQAGDRDFWFRLDRHLPGEEFERKVRDRMGYVLLMEGRPAGLLRYNLFWDSVPFCTLLSVREESRRKGLGRALMTHWETEMAQKGYPGVMTSTRADETAQLFYRRLGYEDAGGLFLTIPGCEEQPAELFFVKAIKR